MSDSQSVIASNRLAVNTFVTAARAISPAQWTTPRAPGKWSPGQVTEHVALAYEQTRRMLKGTFAGPPKPWYQRLLARWLGLPSLLKRGDFGKGPLLAPDFIKPTAAPAPAPELLARLEAAARELEEDLARAGSNRVTVAHPIFGGVALEDLVHFLFIHTNHHRPQLTAGAA